MAQKDRGPHRGSTFWGPSLLTVEVAHRDLIWCSDQLTPLILLTGPLSWLPRSLLQSSAGHHMAAFSSLFRLQPKSHLLKEAFPNYFFLFHFLDPLGC